MEKSIKQILTEKVANAVKDYEDSLDSFNNEKSTDKTAIIKKSAYFGKMQYSIYTAIVASEILNEIFKEDVSNLLSDRIKEERRILYETMNSANGGKFPKEIELLINKIQEEKNKSINA